MFKSSFLVLSMLFILTCGEKSRYDNYRLYRITPRTEKQVQVLRYLQNSQTDFSFWKDPSFVHRPVDIMVPPHVFSSFHEILEEHSLEFKISNNNIQRLIDEEEELISKRPSQFGWTTYYPLQDIHNWLSSLKKSFPGIVELVVGGQTFENRNILGIEIVFNKNNPYVYLEAGIHGNEWVGPASSSWIVNEVLSSPADSIWKRFNYLYIPVLNPDGYIHSFDTERTWRKTRTPYRSWFKRCFGADPNRNWDFHWDEIGTSFGACGDKYAGPGPFSEMETTTLSSFLSSVGSKYDLMITFHSYGQLILYPWGYTNSPAPFADLWKRIGDAASADMKMVHGETYTVGNIYDTIYEVSGSSIEWFYSKFNNTISYSFECRDTGDHGFLLPSNEIIATAEEIQAGIKRILIEYEVVKGI